MPDQSERLLVIAKMANNDPKALGELIRSGTLPVHELTFATEYFGVRSGLGGQEIADTLLPLLMHKSPLVREGVIYGLEGCLDLPDVRVALERIAKNDSSSIIRELAASYMNHGA